MPFVLKNTDYLLVKIMEKNLDLFIKKLIEKEKEIQSKLRFCVEHQFKEEERILRLKVLIVSDIRSEAENCKESNNFNPMFFF